MRRSFLIALLVLLAAAGWLLSGQLGSDSAPVGEAPQAAPASPELARVRVRTITAEDKVREIIVQGRTEASRRAVVKAETAGRVVAIGSSEGARVDQGDLIVRLALDDREAKLTEARSIMAQREIEYRAASELSERSFASRTKVAEAQARLDAARAEVAAAALEVERTLIRAPFDGVLQDRAVEIGDRAAPGTTIATIIDLTPLVVVGDVTERDVGSVEIGSPVQVRLVDGREATGRVRYVSSAGRPGTRTFAVEAEVANPDGRVPEGLTVEMRLSGGTLPAHLVSPAVLSLNEAGRVGVKTVEDGTVRFTPVTIVGDGPQGVWLAGLPPTVTVVTVGQEYVRAGQKVAAVPEGAAPPSGS